MARFDLGLSSEEFYDLQPRQLDAMIKRWERSEKAAEFMVAQHTACTVNFSMARPKEPVSAKDFMPSEWADRPAEPKYKRRRRQAIATEIRSVMDNWLKGSNEG